MFRTTRKRHGVLVLFRYMMFLLAALIPIAESRRSIAPVVDKDVQWEQAAWEYKRLKRRKKGILQVIDCSLALAKFRWRHCRDSQVEIPALDFAVDSFKPLSPEYIQEAIKDHLIYKGDPELAEDTPTDGVQDAPFYYKRAQFPEGFWPNASTWTSLSDDQLEATDLLVSDFMTVTVKQEALDVFVSMMHDQWFRKEDWQRIQQEGKAKFQRLRKEYLARHGLPKELQPFHDFALDHISKPESMRVLLQPGAFQIQLNQVDLGFHLLVNKLAWADRQRIWDRYVLGKDIQLDRMVLLNGKVSDVHLQLSLSPRFGTLDRPLPNAKSLVHIVPTAQIQIGTTQVALGSGDPERQRQWIQLPPRLQDVIQPAVDLAKRMFKSFLTTIFSNLIRRSITRRMNRKFEAFGTRLKKGMNEALKKRLNTTADINVSQIVKVVDPVLKLDDGMLQLTASLQVRTYMPIQRLSEKEFRRMFLLDERPVKQDKPSETSTTKEKKPGWWSSTKRWFRHHWQRLKNSLQWRRKPKQESPEVANDQADSEMHVHLVRRSRVLPDEHTMLSLAEPDFENIVIRYYQ